MKKPKGKKLTKEQKKYNREFNRLRIVVEHVNRRLKIFNIVTTTEIYTKLVNASENFFGKLKQYRAMPAAGYAYANLLISSVLILGLMASIGNIF